MGELCWNKSVWRSWKLDGEDISIGIMDFIPDKMNHGMLRFKPLLKEKSWNINWLHESQDTWENLPKDLWENLMLRFPEPGSDRSHQNTGRENGGVTF